MFNYNYIDTVERLRRLMDDEECSGSTCPSYLDFRTNTNKKFKCSTLPYRSNMNAMSAYQPPPTPLPVATPIQSSPCHQLGHSCNGGKLPYEIQAFIEKQNQYIEHLEKESKFCRDELNHILEKLKTILSDEEGCPACIKTIKDSKTLMNIDTYTPAAAVTPYYNPDLVLTTARNTLNRYKYEDHDLNLKMNEVEMELEQCTKDLRNLKTENSNISEDLASAIQHKTYYKSANYWKYF